MDNADAPRLQPNDAPILVAGLIAAKKTGDKLLVDLFRRQLKERFGIAVQFGLPEKGGRSNA